MNSWYRQGFYVYEEVFLKSGNSGAVARKEEGRMEEFMYSLGYIYSYSYVPPSA